MHDNRTGGMSRADRKIVCVVGGGGVRGVRGEEEERGWDPGPLTRPEQRLMAVLRTPGQHAQQGCAFTL